VSVAFGYVAQIDPDVVERIRRIIGTLTKVVA